MSIPNHINSRISELDLAVAVAVPPGGNWKDVPIEVPLARLATIREGFAAGTGSRSTYYGRLHPERPSYTINTHFTRPGNGCHLHYDYEGVQHRTLSYREAARLQSFPDDFIFHGPRSSIAQQIGNAVPPLLAYQLAKSLGKKGLFVDLFCGAGGLGLGFQWAGWKPIVASDIDANFLKTHSANMSCPTIQGDIRDEKVVREIVAIVNRAKRKFPTLPIWILGGPPCQGFSTAGNKRSMDDDRNHLFNDYARIIRKIKPSGFVFENVMGILNMNKGEVFALVNETLSGCMPNLSHFILQSEKYGVPQRRSRVVILGYRDKTAQIGPPPQLTEMRAKNPNLFGNLPSSISVRSALSDLPPLQNGENGEELEYLTEPTSSYQMLMRSQISPFQYVTELRQTAKNS